MDAVIAIFFWMEAQSDDVVFPYSHDNWSSVPLRNGGNYFHPCAMRGNDRRADERRLHSQLFLIQAHGHSALFREALVTESIAAHDDVKHTEALLPRRRILQFTGRVNQSSAGGQDGQAGTDGVAKRLRELEGASKAVDGRRLATWKHDAIKAIQIPGQAHAGYVRAERFQNRNVLLDAALQGQHTNRQRFARLRRFICLFRRICLTSHVQPNGAEPERQLR